MSTYSYRQFRFDAEYLYNYLLDLRKEESPGVVIERIRQLLIEPSNCSDTEALTALHRIVSSPWAEQEFNLILNRCCYILINYWWLHSEFKQATTELVALLTPPYPAAKSSLESQFVQELLRRFATTDQFAELQDRARIVEAVPVESNELKAQPIRNLIPRYPYLYPYCLLNWDTSEIGQHVVQQLQESRERQFEQDLHRYMTHLLRRSPRSEGLLTAVKNPTLLSNTQLETAVRKFSGKVEGANTYRDLAQQFMTYSKQATTYREVKRGMYDYLTAAIAYSSKPDYGKHHFNRWLSEQLDSMLPQSDHLRPNGSLIMQTCGQLLENLVASPARFSNHVVFVDLNNILGSTFTIGFLLKIVLLCRDVKPNVEAIKAHVAKRFAVMLKHYESKVRGEIEWLVECLENLSIAFSIHFGRADFSWINL
ncbi:hypothetical protein K9N68_32555 [Kovacikia minuta CCNUW1]|uniref:hypothetical protein n=1 Tax=Kovacikia minuta TaxID=2931930 RepID=UPI001CCBB19B|nr:hypothetical protein [Kovacikia minuta]UBF26194.1 hypothetical protein K9N68_32555 [Kovacikia minuta CCNUW1]